MTFLAVAAPACQFFAHLHQSDSDFYSGFKCAKISGMSTPSCVGVKTMLLTSQVLATLSRAALALLDPDGTECTRPCEGDPMEATGISYSCWEAARWVGWRDATGVTEYTAGEEGF
jgi:hypothetical protein